MLPTVVMEPLSRHMEGVKRQHQADLARGFGRVVLPFALDRKYPNAATEWAWQFVFPASRVCTDPRWGPPTRFHLHESVVQKAVAHAARQAGVTKRVGPTHLPAFVCDPPARGRLRHSDGAGVAGARGCQHDDGVHARAQSRSSRRSQSRRSPLKGVVPFRWPQDPAANHARACSAECVKASIRSGLTAPGRGRSRVLGRERTRPTRYSRLTTFMIGAMASVLTSARTGTYGRSTVVGLSLMDARPVTGPLHK